MRVLVTGANGWIGTHVAEALRARGHEVIAGVRRPRLRAITGPALDLDDREGLDAALARLRPEACIHLAWVATPGAYLDSPENVDSLVLGTRLFEALQRAGCTRFVGVGTCFEYDLRPGVLSEDAVPGPTTLYGATKLACGLAIARLAAPGGTRATWARLFYQYGPGEHPDRLVAYLCRQLLRGEAAELTAGTQERDYLHVADVANALVQVVEADDVPSVVNIGSGARRTVADLARAVGTAVGRPELVRLGARPDRPADPPVVVADSARLCALGWAPRFSLDDGIADTVAWWRAHA